ncbi:hypothetical protein VCSRO122_1299 [Vibrio cholerae]|nr:hypothetical protein VCSRO109_1537 [Vibrio cholerae]GHZ03194.1 hypothetical protein VCSRO122_1299 [Vibrio cholerae]
MWIIGLPAPLTVYPFLFAAYQPLKVAWGNRIYTVNEGETNEFMRPFGPMNDKTRLTKRVHDGRFSQGRACRD